MFGFVRDWGTSSWAFLGRAELAAERARFPLDSGAFHRLQNVKNEEWWPTTVLALGNKDLRTP
jgi:hypothetical protein